MSVFYPNRSAESVPMTTSVFAGRVADELSLGVAVTPTTVELITTRGRRAANGAILDRDLIELAPESGCRTATDVAVEVVLRTRATAAQHGYRVHGVEVLGSSAEEPTAEDVVAALAQAGVVNVVTVGSEPATRDSHHAARPPWRHAVMVAVVCAVALASIAVGIELSAGHETAEPISSPPGTTAPPPTVQVVMRSAVPVAPRFDGPAAATLNPRASAPINQLPVAAAPVIPQPNDPGVQHLPEGGAMPGPPGPG